jgi:hypothetical protein
MCLLNVRLMFQNYEIDIKKDIYTYLIMKIHTKQNDGEN